MMKKYQFWAIMLLLIGIMSILMGLDSYINLNSKIPIEITVGLFSGCSGLVTAVIGSIADKA